MSWTVTKTGYGTRTYVAVNVLPSGALECFDNASGDATAYYGPGMWVTAEQEDER